MAPPGNSLSSPPRPLLLVLVNTPQSQTNRFAGRPSLISHSSSTAPLFPELEHLTNLSGPSLQNRENTTFFSGLLCKLNEGRNTPRILPGTQQSIRVNAISLPNGQWVYFESWLLLSTTENPRQTK